MSDILVKIKKLKNMEESARAIGNNEEAAAFAGKVQSLLLEHKLEMAEIESIELDSMPDIEVSDEFYDWKDTGIERTRKMSHWLASLAHVVAQFNGCKSLAIPKSNRVQLIGTVESRAVVTYILTVLARFGRDSMEAAYRREYYEAKKVNATHLMKGFRRSFMTAYVNTIHARLKKVQDARMSEGVTSRGLMVLDQEKAAVDAFAAKLSTGLTNLKAGRYNPVGDAAGRRAGEKAQLAANGVRHTAAAKLA
jgi:hypothetical protein